MVDASFYFLYKAANKTYFDLILVHQKPPFGSKIDLSKTIIILNKTLLRIKADFFFNNPKNRLLNGKIKIIFCQFKMKPDIM